MLRLLYVNSSHLGHLDERHETVEQATSWIARRCRKPIVGAWSELTKQETPGRTVWWSAAKWWHASKDETRYDGKLVRVYEEKP